MKIIIIGAGPGGYETALEAAKREIEVVLIEAGAVGGTCLNEGCIPTKTYCRSAQLVEDMKQAQDYGIFWEPAGAAPVVADAAQMQPAAEVHPMALPSVDLLKVKQRKDEVVQQLRGGIETLMKNKFITLVRGKASLKDAHTVCVIPNSTSEAEGDNAVAVGAEATTATEYTADYIIIATGSKAAVPKFAGADLALTSKEMLELTEIPKRLCVIGAGVIGLEFASIFRSFGSEVTVLEYFDGILPRYDHDLAKRLRLSLKKRGINIITSAAVQAITRHPELAYDLPVDDSQHSVTYQYKGKGESLEADCVLCAVGRVPLIDGLNLDAAGVEYDGRKIITDENMRTSCPSVYAIGDVNGRMMLAHAATYQGLRALEDMVGRSRIECGMTPDASEIKLSIMPSAVFTMPEAAAVGLTEAECEAQNIPYICHKSFFRANGKAVAMGETDGFVKLISYAAPERTSESGQESAQECYTEGQILGCHLFGPHASDLIAEITAMMNKNATVEDLHNIVRAHPTLTEVFRME